MPASTTNSEAGRWLKAARERLGLSTREVERLSRMLAERKRNQEYSISHAWLTDIENGTFTPGLYKLYTLSTIYQCSLDRVLALFGIRIGDLGAEQLRIPLPHTRLLEQPFAGNNRPREIPVESVAGIRLTKTDLVSHMLFGLATLEATLFPRGRAEQAIYGYIGMEDFTLAPLIRPGSFVQIDSAQRTVEQAGWSGIFDRPIYFIELREEYACTWCEQREGHLILIPFPRPRRRIREVRFPADAEIVGRVTAVAMRIIEPRGNAGGTSERA